MKRERKKKLLGSTYQVQTGCGKLYIIINEDDDKIFEVFASIGKAGGCATSQVEALGRVISLGLRSGVEPKQIVRQLSSISCHSPVIIGGEKILSCSDAIAKTLKSYLDEKEEKRINESKDI